MTFDGRSVVRRVHHRAPPAPAPEGSIGFRISASRVHNLHGAGLITCAEDLVKGVPGPPRPLTTTHRRHVCLEQGFTGENRGPA